MKNSSLMIMPVFNKRTTWLRRPAAGGKSRNPGLAALLYASALLFSTGANAVVVNLSFSGDITSITDPSGELSGNGFDTSATTFTGLISYDTALTPSTGSAGGGGARAFYSPTTARVTVDGFDFSVGETLIVDNFDPGTGTDKLWKSTSGIPSVSTCIGTITTCSLNIRFWDSTGTVFSDTSLPTSLDLADFNTHNFTVIGRSGSTSLYQIDGNITSLTVSAVPVPAAVWLFGSGLAGLLGVARHRKARTHSQLQPSGRRSGWC